MGLIRLATYAIVGYAAYAVISDIMQSRSQSGAQRQPGRQTRGAPAAEGGAPAPQITGPAGAGGGRVEETQGTDGGSTPHRVGRGVIST